MQNILKWGVAIGLAGIAVWAISQGKLTSSEGKFLGIIPEKDGLSGDDFAKGGVILGVAAVGGMLVAKFGGPAPIVKAA